MPHKCKQGGGVAIVDSVGEALALVSENQSQFLRQRQSTKTDKEAYDILGQPGRSTLARWKKDETFKTAYDLILLNPVVVEPQGTDNTLLTDSQAMESLALRQMVMLSKQLPVIFQRLFAIATAKTGRYQDSLRAIKQITDMFAIGPEMLTPEARTAIQEQIRRWTGKGE